MQNLTGANTNTTTNNMSSVNNQKSSESMNIGGGDSAGGGNYVHNILDTFDNEKVGFSKFF